MLSRFKSSPGLPVLLFALLACIPYLLQQPLFVAAGDTFLGLVYGIFAGLLTLKLMMLGLKKKVLITRWGSMRQWVDAHNYIGVALLLLALMHAGFQLDSNIHGWTMILLFVLVTTGLVGTISYRYFPKLIERLNPWLDPADAIEEILSLDSELLRQSAPIGKALNARVWEMVQNTRYELKHNVKTLALWALRKDGRDFEELNSEAATNKSAFLAANASDIEHFNKLMAKRGKLFNQLQTAAFLQLVLKGWLRIHRLVSKLFLLLLVVHVIIAFMY